MSDDTLQIEVNGQTLEARKGQRLIEVTDAAGITVPRFCYHHKLPIAANCRMCLVDVEKIPKPVPACATTVMDGMVVRTQSERALNAQRAVMEFLLINHPLDCPVCDEGGECDLQDTALGFGQGESAYVENKRTVASKDLGGLIATEMTRCIHCTRCVRFGEEVGGIQEMGGTGRGEGMRIGTYVERAVESELSGNMIDICPVGALTSKPFRFTARSWELKRQPSVAPHDCIGSNVEVHSVNGKVKRVVPVENEAINEVWISDRDRFSYLALDHQDRLTAPEIKENGSWRQATWEEALELAAKGLKQTAADQLGVLASPSQTNEDYFLLQQLVRGLGGNHIDHRLRQGDFTATAGAGSQANANAITALQATDLVVLVGSNLRKDQPLLWVRVRNALRDHGVKLVVINPKNYDLTIKANEAFIGSPVQMAKDLAGIVKSLPDSAGLSIEGWQGAMATDSHRHAAELISAADNPVVVVGNQSYSSDNYASLNALAAMLATQAGGELIELSYGANSHGAFQAGAVAHGLPGGAEATQPGLNASAMFEQKLTGYLLLGIEPEHDCWDSSAAINALSAADLVVVMNAFVTDTMRDYADVLLPVAAFTEQSGSMVNLLGDMQRFRANVKPLGEARPAWKVLRVLGNHLELDGFEYADLKQVTEAFINAQETTVAVPGHIVPQLGEQKQLMRVADAPIYAIDSLTRRAGPLQQRADSLKAAVYINQVTASAQRLEPGKRVTVSQGQTSLELDWVVDELLGDEVVYIPAGVLGTETLGSMVGPVTVAGS